MCEVPFEGLSEDVNAALLTAPTVTIMETNQMPGAKQKKLKPAVVGWTWKY